MEEGDEMKLFRSHLIAWSIGVLMERDKKGNVLVINDGDCAAAENAIQNGETVELMDSECNVVSTISLVDGEYVEKEVTR